MVSEIEFTSRALDRGQQYKYGTPTTFIDMCCPGREGAIESMIKEIRSFLMLVSERFDPCGRVEAKQLLPKSNIQYPTMSLSAAHR